MGTWASRRGRFEHVSWLWTSRLMSLTSTQRAHNCTSTALPTAMTMSTVSEPSLPLPSQSPEAPRQLSEGCVYLSVVTAKSTAHGTLPCSPHEAKVLERRPKDAKHSLKERKPQLRWMEISESCSP